MFFWEQLLLDQVDFSQGVTFQGTFCHVVLFLANLS